MYSNIRIVQSALRASRKNINEPNKITKIILPILDLNNNIDINDNWLNNNDFKKIKEIIYKMSLEDETITQKIKVLKINIDKQHKLKNNINNINNEFGEYNDNLTNQLKLGTIDRVSLGITYENAKKIIANKNIKSKAEYYELCDIDYRLPKEPDKLFKKQFKNWIEYLSIKKEYYDLDTCKSKVAEYIALYPELKKYNIDLLDICIKLCEIDPKFPPYDLWNEYYNIELHNIITVNKVLLKRHVI